MERALRGVEKRAENAVLRAFYVDLQGVDAPHAAFLQHAQQCARGDLARAAAGALDLDGILAGVGLVAEQVDLAVLRRKGAMERAHPEARILRDVEEPLINAALIATRGNQIKAAELLGVNRNTLRKKIRDLDIKIMRSMH